MVNLPRALREALADEFDVRWPEVAERALSRTGRASTCSGSTTAPRSRASTSPRRTGGRSASRRRPAVPLKCAFCLTGIAGYQRNLKAAEILGQVATVMAEHPWTRRTRPGAADLPWNIVVMGMGEPLLNYEATVAALRVLMDADGFAVAPRKLTLSTVGILPALEKLAAGAGAAQPRDQPARPQPGAAARADADRGEVRAGRRDRGGAALSDPARGPRHLRVRAARRRQRHEPRTPASWRACSRAGACKVNLIPLNPAPEIPFEAADAAAVGRLLRDARRRGSRRLRAPLARPGHPGRLWVSSTRALKRRGAAAPAPVRGNPGVTALRLSSPLPRGAGRPHGAGAGWDLALARAAVVPLARVRCRSRAPRSTSSTPRAGWSSRATGWCRTTGPAVLRQADR